MSENSKRSARASETADQYSVRDEMLLGDRVAARVGPEVIVFNLACKDVDKEGIRREVLDALKSDDGLHVKRVTFLNIGQAAASSRGNSQALIDRFLLRRGALEDWARNVGLRVVFGYLRPVGDMFSAIFEMEPTEQPPTAAGLGAAIEVASDTPTP